MPPWPGREKTTSARAKNANLRFSNGQGFGMGAGRVLTTEPELCGVRSGARAVLVKGGRLRRGLEY